MKRPSFQFYPSDWLNDEALRMCSLASRGLWADMMSIMHGCLPYGYLVVKGKGILPDILARRVGASLQEVETLLTELNEHGVYGLSDEGWIFSRRMVRDEQNRQIRAANGVKSLDNPNVPRPKDTLKDGGKVSFRPSPSSSSSSSSSSSLTTTAEIASLFPEPSKALAMLNGMAEGMNTPGGRAIPVEVMIEAASDMQVQGCDFTPYIFKAFCRKIMDRPKSNGQTAAPRKASWLVAKELTDHDEYLNRQPDVQAKVEQAKTADPEWWMRMQAEAKTADRWAIPYAYDQLTREQ